MKKYFALILLLLAMYSCNNDSEFQIDKKPMPEKTIRSIQDVEAIVRGNIPESRAIDSMKVFPLTTKDLPTSEDIALLNNNSLNDTLLYFVEKVNNPMIISANVNCNPIIAILDNPNISFSEELKNPSDKNFGLLSIIDNAISYNEDPQIGGSYKSSRSINTVTEELQPKVPVEWSQNYPFNEYCPNNYPAGCVAIATAQAFMVTRHVGTFNNVPLDYDQLIKVKNASYASSYPTETNTIAMFIRQIGVAVGMKYGKNGSSAKTKDAIKLFTFNGMMNLSTTKRDIKKTLHDYARGIVIISSRTKKNGIFGNARGEGHAYIADGYKVFSDNSDLIHINYGWGSYYNGYYLSNLYSPHFTNDAPKSFPHAWDFYCIYK